MALTSQGSTRTRISSTHRTQEVAGSSPASSISKVSGSAEPLSFTPMRAGRALVPSSRAAMSRQNVELVKSVHPASGTSLAALFGDDAEESRRFEALASLLTPDFEAFGGDLRGGPGLAARAWVGSLAGGWREWLHPWETYWTEVEEFIDAGNDRVVVLVRDHGRLRGSDSEVELAGASVWTLREGKVARIEFHADRENALKAAGVVG